MDAEAHTVIKNGEIIAPGYGYPYDKSEITGINYEPWHYRYVGKEAAQAMYESGLCPEEYLIQLQVFQ